MSHRNNPVYDLTTRALSRLVESTGGTVAAAVVRRLGLVDPARGMADRVRGVLLPDERALRLDGETYRFRVSTRFEYHQFEKYASSPDGPTLSQFAGELRPDDVIWDVGANVGVFSVVATTYTDGPVFAFEPIPENVRRIEENLRLNGRHATVRRVALSDEAGEAELRVSSGSGTGAYGLLDDDSSSRTVPVETVPGDELVVEGHPPPTVLKVDVQGSELAVLRGLEESLDECRVVFCNVYEKHFDAEHEDERIRALLEASGLRVDRIGGWNGGYFLRATRDTTA